MRIAIDCRLIGNSGIGTYIENVLAFMVQNTETEFLLIGDERKLGKYGNLPNCHILHCTLRSFTPKELLFFPTKEVNRCDAFYTPNFNLPLGLHIPIYSTIHDILFFETENFGSWVHRRALHWYISRALRISRKVFTVSEFSKSRIQDYFKTAAEIVVAKNGVNKELREYASNHGQPQKRHGIIFIGNLKKHKGIDLLWEAYKKLKDENPKTTKLTIVGNINFRTKDETIIREIEENKDKIAFYSNIDNDTLYRLISESEVLVSPSRYEGFGLPPLEALYLGTPVIISDIPVYKEIYNGLPVTFFKAGDANDLLKKLQSFVPHTEEVRNIIDETYSYKKTAQLIYRTVIRFSGCFACTDIW